MINNTLFYIQSCEIIVQLYTVYNSYDPFSCFHLSLTLPLTPSSTRRTLRLSHTYCWSNTPELELYMHTYIMTTGDVVHCPYTEANHPHQLCGLAGVVCGYKNLCPDPKDLASSWPRHNSGYWPDKAHTGTWRRLSYPSMVKPGAIQLSDLDAKQKADLHYMLEEYKYTESKWERELTALAQFTSHLALTVANKIHTPLQVRDLQRKNA